MWGINTSILMFFTKSKDLIVHKSCHMPVQESIAGGRGSLRGPEKESGALHTVRALWERNGGGESAECYANVQPCPLHPPLFYLRKHVSNTYHVPGSMY